MARGINKSIVESFSTNIFFIAGSNNQAIAAVPPATPKDKIKARKSFVKVSKKLDLKNTGLWTRVNAINSKWFLDDVSYIIENLANKLDVIMLPMINTPEEILFADRIIALNEAKYKLKKQKQLVLKR